MINECVCFNSETFNDNTDKLFALPMKCFECEAKRKEKNSRHRLVIDSIITQLNSSSSIDFTFNYLFLCDNLDLLFIRRSRRHKNQPH